MSLFTFPPNPTFWVTNLQIPVVQNVPTDHTDHFRFHSVFEFDLIFSIEISLFWKKSLFQVSVKKDKFIGRHMGLFLKVSHIVDICIIYIYIYILPYSWKLLAAEWALASGGFFSGNSHFLIFWTCSFFEPGQTTMPMWKVSKFCAKPRYGCSEMSHLSPIP